MTAGRGGSRLTAKFMNQPIVRQTNILKLQKSTQKS